MIKFLQSGNKAAKYILGGFLLILAASMVTYLIPGFAGDASLSRAGVVATVAGQEIHNDEVTKQALAEARAQRAPEQFMYIFRQRAIQRLVQRAEVIYEAERMGLKVSDQEVQDEMQNCMYKVYFFPDGKWIGADKYKEMLTQGGGTVEEFERNIRHELMQQKLFAAVSASASVPDSEVEAAYKERNTKIKFQYAVLSLEDIEKGIKPTDAELNAFFTVNKATYENYIPEKRTIRYFVLPDKDAESKVTVTDADLQAYYDQHHEENRVEEHVRVRHILINAPAPGPDGKEVDQKAVDEARAKAQDILKQVKAGGDFAALAKKYSDDKGDTPGSAEKGGEMGLIVKGQTEAEFEKVAFSQAKGQISDLVRSSRGFHIVQTEEKEDAHLKPLAEVKGTIEPIIKAKKTGDLREKISAEATELVKKDGLDKAAAKYKAQVVQSNPIAQKDTLPGIGPSPDLMNAIFTTAEKSPPQSARSIQAYVFFELTKIEPARTPPFAEIKDKVTSDFKSQRAADLLRRNIQTLANRARVEHDLTKAAKEAGATVKVSALVGRSDQVPDIGSMGGGGASAAFSLKSGETSDPISLGNKQAVLQVTDRQEPPLTDPEYAKQRDGLREQLVQERQQRALDLYITSLSARLKKEGKIKIYETEKTNPLRPRS